PAPRQERHMHPSLVPGHRLGAFACLGMLLTLASAAHADDARTLFDQGQMRKAAAACEQRLAASANDAVAGAILSRIRSNQGDMALAEKLALAAVAADPRNADAQYALAEVYGREAQHAGMLKAAGYAGKLKKTAEAALAVDPKHVNSLDILV